MNKTELERLAIVETKIDLIIDDMEEVKKQAVQSDIDLKRYISDKIDSQKEAISIAMTASKEAILKAENANEKRFESVNEFRNTLKDQQSSLLPRTEYLSLHKNLEDKVIGVQETFNNQLLSLKDNLSGNLDLLKTGQTLQQGAKSGIKELIGYILAGITIIGFIITQFLITGGGK